MKKLLITALLAMCALAGCGGNSGKETSSNGADSNSQISSQQTDFEIDEKKLKEEGYEDIAGIAYARIEDNEGKPIVYLVCCKNQPEQNIYIWSQIMSNIEDVSGYSIVWNSKEYFIDMTSEDIETEEGMMSLLPHGWQEIFKKMQADGKGVDGLVSKADAEDIDDAVEKFTENLENNSNFTEKPENDYTDEKEKDNMEIIDEFKYNYDDYNRINVALEKKKDNNRLVTFIYGFYEEDNMQLMILDFVNTVTPLIDKDIDISYMSIIDSGSQSYIYTRTNGQNILNTISDLDVESMPDVSKEYVTKSLEMSESLNKFYVKHKLADKSQNKTIYKDKNVKITFTGITGDKDNYKINLTIKNKSNKTLTIQARETSINGIMIDPICSIEIAPKKIAKDYMSIAYDEADKVPMSEVKNIETKFHIFNDNDWSDYYDTKNIVVMK